MRRVFSMSNIYGKAISTDDENQSKERDDSQTRFSQMNELSSIRREEHE